MHSTRKLMQLCGLAYKWSRAPKRISLVIMCAPVRIVTTDVHVSAERNHDKESWMPSLIGPSEIMTKISVKP